MHQDISKACPDAELTSVYVDSHLFSNVAPLMRWIN